MKRAELEVAEWEAERFLRKVQDLQKAVKRDGQYITGCIESGAVRRSSMDLTRALARLRR